MTLSPEEIAARLAEVRRSYLSSLQDKRDTIVSHWSSLRTQWNDETYQALYLLVHTLAGSAETFDLANVGRDARNLVDAFKQYAVQQPLEAKRMTTLTNKVDTLVSSMTSALTELDTSDS